MTTSAQRAVSVKMKMINVWGDGWVDEMKIKACLSELFDRAVTKLAVDRLKAWLSSSSGTSSCEIEYTAKAQPAGAGD